MPTRLAQLDSINVDDLLGALGSVAQGFLHQPFAALARPLVRPFSRLMLQFDRLVEAEGLGTGARWLNRRLAAEPKVLGTEKIPLSGPVLFVSNHPGLTDTVALFTSLPRPDLKIVAAARPFLQALAAVSRCLLMVVEGQEAAVIAPAVSHLRNGGSLLTFPAGRIEPDPSLHPGEASRLEGWSASTALFLRLVPGLVLVPVKVSGVLAPRAQHHWLPGLRRTRQGREHAAALLQLMDQVWRPGHWSVRPLVKVLTPLRLGTRVSAQEVQHALDEVWISP